MSEDFTVWHRDVKASRKRTVRIETFGKSFMLFENQNRSEPYYFGDLVYRGLDGGAHIFGIDDGLKSRPHWQIGFTGGVPDHLAALLPKMQKSALGNMAMLIIAFLCLAIVWMAAR